MGGVLEVASAPTPDWLSLSLSALCRGRSYRHSGINNLQLFLGRVYARDTRPTRNPHRSFYTRSHLDAEHFQAARTHRLASPPWQVRASRSMRSHPNKTQGKRKSAKKIQGPKKARFRWRMVYVRCADSCYRRRSSPRHSSASSATTSTLSLSPSRRNPASATCSARCAARLSRPTPTVCE